MKNTTNNDNNIDYGFKEISNKDFLTTDESLSTTIASISTRQIQDIGSIANEMYTRIQIPEAYRIDAKPYIERPFYVGSVEFPQAATRYSWLSTPIKRLPGDVIRSNQALLNAMKIGSLYRADLMLNISMAGTITHAGCILVAILPPLNNYPNSVGGDVRTINTFLSSPHAFLYANEATSVNLTVPWYCNTDLATLNMDLTNETTMDLSAISGNYATLAFMVLNPLAPSTGSSTKLTIVIEACFKNLDILVPTPRFATWAPQSGMIEGLIDTTKKGIKRVAGDFIDKGINSLFGLVGLHNPNVATIKERDIITVRNFPNVVDAEQQFEKLDPYANFNRIMDSPIYGSAVDEMSISHIVSKRQMLGSFIVNKQDAVGKLYWIRPISPFQGGINGTEVESECANNIELMHSLHRGWRGDLKIIITSVMNNKQQCKLKLLKMYNPPKNALSGVPSYQSIANAPSHLMEFTQGGQEHEIVLPFLSRNEIMPCSENLNFEAFAHGLYYIYLAQPLANSDGSPDSIEFNVFIQGMPNLTFYGYTTKNIVTEFFPFPYPNSRQLVEKPILDIKQMANDRSHGSGLIDENSLVLIKDLMESEREKWVIAAKNVIGQFQEEFHDSPSTKDESEEVFHDALEEDLDANSLVNDRSESEGECEEIFHDAVEECVDSDSSLESGAVECDGSDASVFTKIVRSVWSAQAKVWRAQVGGDIKVMNEPQVQKDKIDVDAKELNANYIDRLQSNLDMRPLIRRMYITNADTIEVPQLGANAFKYSLANILAEQFDSTPTIQTPICAISNMYYGKNVGFKINMQIQRFKLQEQQATVSQDFRVYFVPPGLTLEGNNLTMCGMGLNPTAIDQSSLPQYGLFTPYQVLPVRETEEACNFEFVIPDVTYFKYMGSPNKYTVGGSSNEPLATCDFGAIYVLFMNNTSDVNIVNKVVISVGLTDESRLGHHVAATVFKIIKIWSPYLEVSGQPATGVRNPNIYKGFWL